MNANIRMTLSGRGLSLVQTAWCLVAVAVLVGACATSPSSEQGALQLREVVYGGCNSIGSFARRGCDCSLDPEPAQSQPED